MQYFKSLIGQAHLKNSLGFFIEGSKRGGAVPPILLTGAKGLGKTEFARNFAKELKRPFLEINCATIKNGPQFFEQIFVPIIMGNEVTLLLDEAHAMPKDLQEAFLTVFNVEKKQTLKHFEYKGSQYEFDFTRQTYLFATTDQNKIRPALKDRFEELDFKPYSDSELGAILKLGVEGVQFQNNILDDIIGTLRGNARAAVKRAKHIELFCATRNSASFGTREWKDMCNVLSINPNGLTNAEIQVLQILEKRGACTLTTLSAATDIPRTVLQQEVERYLLRKGLIRIDNTREITGAGSLALSKL